MPVLDELELPFCERCGSSNMQVHGNARTCTQCHSIFYVNPRPCNAVYITDHQGRYLLVTRKVAPFAGMYDVPGGFIDVAETAEHSVERELAEELGVSITQLSYVCSLADRYEYKGIRYHTLGLIYTARLDSKTITVGDDVSAYAFFDPLHIPWDQIGFPSVKKALKQLIDTH